MISGLASAKSQRAEGAGISRVYRDSGLGVLGFRVYRVYRAFGVCGCERACSKAYII